jgi:Skp family chaperone for outer membrane proteins
VLKLCPTLALLIVTLPCAAVLAQNNAPTRPAASAAPRGTVIAIIDMMYLMNKHEKMIALKEGSQKKSRELQSQIQARGKELQKEQEKLRELKLGTPEYRSLQEKLVQRGAELEADMKLGDAQIQEEHLKAQLDILMEVQAAVKNFASRRGIDLVLNFDGEPANADKLETSARAFRSIVQYQNEVDITLQILEIVSPNNTVTNAPATPVVRKNTAPATGGAPPRTTRK